MFDNKNFEARAYGCHPKQVRRFNERYGHLGVKWDRRGRPTFENVKALDDYKKKHGVGKAIEQTIADNNEMERQQARRQQRREVFKRMGLISA
jgi:hypothetical protein